MFRVCVSLFFLFHLSVVSSVIYGKGSWPQIIILIFFFIALLLAVQELVTVVLQTRLRKSLLRKSFLLVFSLFLFWRVLVFITPFPFNLFWGIFVADQIPRYLLFVAWEFLALWLGSAVFGTYGSNKWRHVLFRFSFAMLLLLTFIFSIVLTYYHMVCCFFSPIHCFELIFPSLFIRKLMSGSF